MLLRSGMQTMQLLQFCGNAGHAQTMMARCFASSHLDLIKQLRERSGSPISDVKACLEAAGWDVDSAYEQLRKRGLAAAAKKASRHAAEGLIGCLSAQGGRAAVIVEVNSETDFVARNELFQGLVRDVVSAVQGSLPRSSEAEQGSAVVELPLDQVLATRTAGGASVSDACAAVAGQVRENVRVRRAFRAWTPSGVVSTYLHQSPGPALGRIATLVVLQPTDSKTPTLTQAQAVQADEVGKQLAMHVAGMRPVYPNRAAVPHDVLQQERAILAAHPSTAGKAPAVVQRIIEGRLAKFYEDAVLPDQRFVLDDALKVGDVVARLSKVMQTPLEVAHLLRVQCGEGLDATARPDFAAEVAAMVAG